MDDEQRRIYAVINAFYVMMKGFIGIDLTPESWKIIIAKCSAFAEPVAGDLPEISELRLVLATAAARYLEKKQ